MTEFNKLIQVQFNKMCATGKLFRSSLTGQQVWDIYINSFPEEQNPIFRDPTSTTYNCNLCKNFIRRYGNIVSIDENYNIVTIFDVPTMEFVAVSRKLTLALKSAPISEVFFETFNELNSLPYESCTKNNTQFKLGIDKNVKRYTKEEAEKYGVVQPNEIRTFNHLHLFVPKQFVDISGNSVEALMADYRDAKNVFQRAMESISIDTYNLVRDLINQGSLLDGQTHLYKVEQMIPFALQYNQLSQDKKDNWCWVNSYKLPFAKFKNELIGVLCTELAEGKELNEACQAWNKRIDPANYMKAIAPITKRQIEEAKKFVEENGYEASFDRRFATIDDIKASEILHVNVGTGQIPSVSIFDSVKSTSTRHKRSEFDGVEEVSIDKFMKDILPNCTSVEAFLSNGHEGNMVSLTTANIKESTPIFKWSNNYSWTFNGNLAGKSQIKENVKSAGGKIEGTLRCSLQWNDDDTKGNVDFDLHCKESRGTEIYYSNKKSYQTGGWLDVDMIRPAKIGIENITWQNKIMPDGEYLFFVRNFCGGPNKGFKIEIEFDDNTFNYYYAQPTSYKQDIKVAAISVKSGIISIIHYLSENSVSKDIYGLPTNEFHKVNLVCLSPNHWDNNNVGNKHYFFMLDKCKCPVSIRSFHAENLIPELANHRKVLEVLGNTTMINPTDKQLSGLGFNATVKDELIVKLSGSFKRVIKIKF
jgi:hypothetical protein